MKSRITILAVCCLAVSWYYAAAYWAESGRGFPVEFYPFWNASRAILHGTNPYGAATTQENQIAAYGSPVGNAGIENQQRFAYPVYAAVPLLPLGLLPFPAANNIAFVLFAALTLLSIGWLRHRWDWSTVFYCAFTASGFPIVYDLCSRQPTLLFFGLAVAGLALARSGWLVPAGICAALSLGKPHLALSVSIAELIWTVAEWRQRRRFATSFVLSAVSVFGLSCLLSRGWVSGWISTLQAYTRYNKPSLIVSLFGSSPGLVVSTLVLAGLVFALWQCRSSELLFLAGVAVAVIQLLIPYANYNAVILLIPTIWILDNGSQLASSGELGRFMLGLTRVSIVLFLAINPFGAILLHTSQSGRFIAWVLPSMATHALLFCVGGTMLTQCVTILTRRRHDTADVASLISQ